MVARSSLIVLKFQSNQRSQTSCLNQNQGPFVGQSKTFELLPRTNSISLNLSIREFVAQVKVSTLRSHRVLASILLDFRRQLLFHGLTQFPWTQKILLNNLPCSTSSKGIDGHSIPSGYILENSTMVPMVLGSLAYVISLNISDNLVLSIFIGSNFITQRLP